MTTTKALGVARASSDACLGHSGSLLPSAKWRATGTRLYQAVNWGQESECRVKCLWMNQRTIGADPLRSELRRGPQPAAKSENNLGLSANMPLNCLHLERDRVEWNSIEAKGFISLGRCGAGWTRQS